VQAAGSLTPADSILQQLGEVDIGKAQTLPDVTAAIEAILNG